MRKQSSRISRSAGMLTIVCGVLVFSSAAWGQSLSGACTDRVLRGDYGFIVEGVVLPGPGVQVPVRGVHMTNFDGEGHLTQVDHIVIPGGPPLQFDWTKGIGTYHVNADCTGTAHIDVPGTTNFVNLRFVVVGNGSQLYTVVAAPFDGPERAVTSTGIRRNN